MSPSGRGVRQVQRLAEAKAASQAADVMAGVWLAGLKARGRAHATAAAMDAAVAMYGRFASMADDDPVLLPVLGKLWKTGTQGLDSDLRDVFPDEFWR
jgi:hypothetical protein